MSKTVANFKCEVCGDIFTAYSDKYYTCKCGKSKVKPEYFSTSYDPEVGYNCEWLRDGKDHTYYDESEVLVFDRETAELYNKVKELSKLLDFSVYENYVQKETGTEMLNTIRISKNEYIPYSNDEVNNIKFNMHLGGFFRKPNISDVKERLYNFLNFLIKIESEEVNLKDRKQLISDELNLEWDRKQLELYDYSFYF